MKLNSGGLSSIVIGREKETISIKQYIKFSQHIVLSAPRRYGKTTLINRVLDEIEDEYLIVKVDIFQATSIKELCHIYLNNIYKSIGIMNFLHSIKESIFSLLDRFKLQYQQDGIKIGYEISKEEDDYRLLEKTFNFADSFASLANKKMVVFFDEFGDVNKFGEDFLKHIRSLMQTHQNITYIFAGSQASVINTIFLDDKNAFFNFASLIHLDFLDFDTSAIFLNDLNIEQKRLSQDAIDEIIITTKLHPFYLIKTLAEAYILTLFDSNKNIEKSHINQAILKILDDNNAYFESIWQQINNKKYKGQILKSLIKKSNTDIQLSSSYKSQLLRELKNDIIINNKNQFCDPFFRLWLDKG